MKALLVLLGIFFIGTANAQYPNKPLRLVVPFAPGGSTDIFARLLAERAQGPLGQPIVVENRSGAAGNLGANEVAKGAPDGYTLLMATTGVMAINNSLYKNMTYDAAKDLEPVLFVASITNVLIVPPEADAPLRPLVLNLRAAAVPDGFERVLEVVPADESARGPLRERWKHYQAGGVEVNKFDM